MELGTSATTTSIISAVPGTSLPNGRTHGTQAGYVAAKVSLTGTSSATEDTARSVGAEKAVEEIGAGEVPPTQDGASKTKPAAASRRRSSRTTTAKKPDIERAEEEAPVSTQKRRFTAGPTSPGKRRKVVAPTPVEVEGDILQDAISHVDLPRTSRKRKADAQMPVKATLVEEAQVKVLSHADLPQTPRRRKSDPTTPVKVNEVDSLAKAASQSNSPKTLRKRGRSVKMNEVVGSTSTPASSKTESVVQQHSAANDVAKGSETVGDDQIIIVGAEMGSCSGVTTTPRRGHTKDIVSSKSPAKRKRRVSVDGCPSKKKRSGPVKSEQVEPLSLGLVPLPLLGLPSGNTPSLWASNKTDLVILTSKLNMVTTIFVDQESAIGIAIQDDGEVELSITRDCSRQSALINSLIPLDVPEAPEPPPKDVAVSSPINLLDSHLPTPVIESEIPTAHASIPIYPSSDGFPGRVNTVAHPSLTQATEIQTSDSSLPDLSNHEPLKTCDLLASGRVSQQTSFGDLARSDIHSPATPSFPPIVRVSPPPPGLGRPDAANRPSPSVASRDQTILDVPQAPFLFGNNQVPLPPSRSSTPPRTRHWDDYPRETLDQRSGPTDPLHHSRNWDSKWDNYPQERASQRSGSPIRHHQHWDNTWDNGQREKGSRPPTYLSPEGHSSLPFVAKDPRRDPLSGHSVGPGKMTDPRRRSPARRIPAPVSDYQSQVSEWPQVSILRSSKGGLPSFKKIRSAPGGSTLPLSSTAATSSPRLQGMHIQEPRSTDTGWPSRPDAQVHGGSHLGLLAQGRDCNHFSSSFLSTSARRPFYNQSDHPARRTESTSNTYGERLERYSSKKSSLTAYMTGMLSQRMEFQRNPSKRYPSSGHPLALPLPQNSTAATVPIIKEKADLLHPFPPPAGGPLSFVSKRSSSPSLYVPSAISPPDNLLKISRPSSPDSLYAPSPTRHDIQPLKVPCEDTYMLDEEEFSPPLPPATIASSTARVEPLALTTMKPPPLTMSLQGEYDANTTPQPPYLSSRSEEEWNMPNMSQSDTPCKEGAAYASNIREAEQNDSLRQQLRAEQIVNTDLARHKPNGLYFAPQEMVNVSESNHGIHEPLQAINPGSQQPTNNDVELFVQADVPDDVAPMAKENEEIVIHYPPEVQQFTAIDFPVLLFVSLPGYGYASLGYFRNLGIVSKTSADEGKRTIWRARFRWVADEEYGELEDETFAKGCWWSEQKVVEGLEDKFVRDQCPDLGMGLRAVEQWWCRGCGRVNREDGWKWRRCLSEKCKDKQPDFLKALSLDEVRGRNDRMPMARPHEMASFPGITTTTWEDGTVTYMYPLSASCLVKHIFTGNYPPLQEDASRLWVGLQGKGVELFRDRDGPYYTCAFVGNMEDWPESVKEASEVVGDSAVGYGEFPSGMDIRRVEVLAWFIKGSAKFKAHETGAVSQVLRAKQSLVGILSLGCEVEILLHKCGAVAELPSMEGLLTFMAEDGTEQATVDDEPSVTKSSSPRKRKVADTDDLSIHMVHGDVLILSGDDFEYNIKRSGCGMLVIVSSNV